MKIIKQNLTKAFKFKPVCEWCGKAGPVDPHHIFAKGIGGGQQLDVSINLIALCRPCHNLFHDGHILRTDLLAKVAAREGVLQDDIVAEIYRLRRLSKHATQEAGDGEVAAAAANQRRFVRPANTVPWAGVAADEAGWHDL